MPSGMGGWLILPGDLSCDVQEWTLDKTCDAQETTDTGCGGWKRFEGGNKGFAGRFTVVWDPTSMIDVDMSLDVGDAAVVQFQLGGSAKFYEGQILVTGLSTRNPAQGDTVIRQDVSYQGTGILTNPVT